MAFDPMKLPELLGPDGEPVKKKGLWDRVSRTEIQQNLYAAMDAKFTEMMLEALPTEPIKHEHITLKEIEEVWHNARYNPHEAWWPKEKTREELAAENAVLKNQVRATKDLDKLTDRISLDARDALNDVVRLWERVKDYMEEMPEHDDQGLMLVQHLMDDAMRTIAKELRKEGSPAETVLSLLRLEVETSG